MLGPVRAWRGETEINLGPPLRRALLAVLLVQAGRPMGIADIVDALWGEHPPATAVNQVHSHVGTLRRLVEPDLSPRAPGRWLLRSAGAYRLDVDAESLDLLRYRRLWQQARQAAADGWLDQAVQLATQALELWHGPAASGVDWPDQAQPAVTTLDREYLSAAQEAADLALLAGVPCRVLAVVEQAAARAPFDESVQARLVRVLAAAGARAEALNVYRAVAARLADDLGIDPGSELCAAQESVLRAVPQQRRAEPPVTDKAKPARTELIDTEQTQPHANPEPTNTEPTNTEPTEPEAPAEPAEALPARPAQLPADLATFAGRRDELAAVVALSGADTSAGETAVIGVIAGMAGVGKTAFAVHWAHQVADRYPDAQLYVNLRGFDPAGAVMSPTDALYGFLLALGVPPVRIPNGVDAQAAVYRSVLAGRRVLVLLDNALDLAQVQPLLPGSPGCLAIVTSRNQLCGLFASTGAHSVTLDLLPTGEARDLLVRRLGASRVAAEPQGLDDILRPCAGLPLALAIVAARAATNPGFPLAELAAELRGAGGSLDAFAGPDAASNMRTVFSLSYHALSPPAARLFRLLGVHAGPDIATSAAASLAGVEPAAVRLWLAELSQANLATEHRPGRYTQHDLLRAYANELLNAVDAEPERQAARHRLLDHYLHTAHTAAMLLAPARQPITLAPAQPGVRPEPLSDDEQAMAWFGAERRVLLASAAHAAETGFDSHAWQLPWTMDNFLFR